MNGISRGKLAQSAGVGIETIRFYENKGLIPKPKRSESGYRQYSEEDRIRIQFIKRAQELGFTLKEIKELLGLQEKPGTSCNQVKDRADSKLAEIDGKIADLKKMRRSLIRLAEACEHGKKAVSECRVLDCFETLGKC
jgi:MerR family mercuric resistance operon transcriptional regulator